MTKERASIFDAEDLGAGDFRPTAPHRPDASAVRQVAEAAGFTARDPAPAEPTPQPRPQRRRKTGRNLQLNLKVSHETLTSFYALADQLGLSQAEAFERAVSALKEKLRRHD